MQAISRRRYIAHEHEQARDERISNCNRNNHCATSDRRKCTVSTVSARSMRCCDVCHRLASHPAFDHDSERQPELSAGIEVSLPTPNERTVYCKCGPVSTHLAQAPFNSLSARYERTTR